MTGLLRVAKFFVANPYEVGPRNLPALTVDSLTNVFIPVTLPMPGKDYEVFILPFGEDHEAVRKFVRRAILDNNLERVPVAAIENTINLLAGNVATLARFRDERFPAAVDVYRADGRLHETVLTLKNRFESIAERANVEV